MRRSPPTRRQHRPPHPKKSGLDPRPGGTTPAPYLHEYVRLLKMGLVEQDDRHLWCVQVVLAHLPGRDPLGGAVLESSSLAAFQFGIGPLGRQSRSEAARVVRSLYSQVGQRCARAEDKWAEGRGAVLPAMQRPSGESLVAKPPPAPKPFVPALAARTLADGHTCSAPSGARTPASRKSAQTQRSPHRF